MPLSLDFSLKGMRIVSPPHFVHNSSRKMFFMVYYSINWPNFIVWQSLLLEILDNMCISIIYFPDCVWRHEFWNYRPYQSIPAVFVDDQKVKTQNLSILNTKRAFKVKKTFFIIFKELSVVKNFLRPETAHLTIYFSQVYLVPSGVLS